MLVSNLGTSMVQGKRVAYRFRSRDGVAKDIDFSTLRLWSNVLLDKLNFFIKPDDVVGIYLDKCIEIPPLMSSIFRAKAILCPIFSTIGTEAIRERLESVDPKLIITSSKKLKYIPSGYQTVTIEELIDINDDYTGVSDVVEDELIEDNHKAIIHFTSGTTGRPKGAVHTHKVGARYKDTFIRAFRVMDDDTYYCGADHAWVTGTTYGVIAPLLAQKPFLIADIPIMGKAFKTMIEDEGVNIIFTAPSMLRTLKRDRIALSNIKRIFSAGESLDIDTYHYATANLSGEIIDNYFQSELGSMAIANFEMIEGSMGRGLEDVLIKIIDDKGSFLDEGIVGNLSIHKSFSSMFVDYYGNSDAYMSKFIGDYYITGDLAYIKDSNIYYKGRADDVLNPAGHLISPQEIENILLKDQRIEAVACIGEEDEVLGQVVRAYVKTSYDLSNDFLRELRLLVRDNISSYAVPKSIVRVTDLPKTSSGKLIRNREMLDTYLIK